MEAKNALTILMEKIIEWYELVIRSIPNLIVAFFVVIVFFILARIVKKVSYNLLLRVTKSETITNLLRSFLATAIFVVGLFITLEILHLEKTVASILAGAGVLGLALGFAFQEIASNFVSGILIAFRKPYKVGDTIKIENYFGKVSDINLRITQITDDDGLDVIIPNKDMFTKPFTNYTNSPTRRISIDVGVSYDADLDFVEEITKKALKETINIISDVEVYFKEFGDSSINLSAKFWIKYPNNSAYVESKHQAIKNIKRAYANNDISIPFPIRTLEISTETVRSLKS